MATKLRKISYDRVDLVDVGANPKAHVMLFKRASASDVIAKSLAALKALSKRAATLGDSEIIAKFDKPLRSFDEQLAVKDAHCDLYELAGLWYSFDCLSHEIVELASGTTRDALLRDAAIQFSSALVAGLTDMQTMIESADADTIGKMSADEVEKIGRKISASRLRALKDMHASLGTLLSDVQPGDTIMTTEEVQKRVDEAVAKAVTDAVAATKKTADEAIAKANADLAKAQSDATEATNIAKAERDKRLDREFADIVKSLKGLPDLKEDADGDAKIFRKFAEVAPEEWERVHDLLTKAHTALKASSAFTEIGKGNGGDAKADTAEGEIFAEAEKLVKADTTGKLTREGAIAKMSNDPAHAALMKRYDLESRSRNTK